MRTSLSHRVVVLMLISFTGLISLRTLPPLLCKSGQCVFSPGKECFDGELMLPNHVWWEGFNA